MYNFTLYVAIYLMRQRFFHNLIWLYTYIEYPPGEHMITTYHRPKSIDEALKLLSNSDVFPLGGGTRLSHIKDACVKVVDLQDLGLDTLRKSGNSLEIGATVTLQQLHKSGHINAPLKTAIEKEAPLNIRNAATIAGTLVSANGRSAFTTVMLALNAILTFNGRSETIQSLGEYLPLRPSNLPGQLITAITIPINTDLAFEIVSRSPSDKPIICAALAAWSSGRMRLVLGGYGSSPLLAMDGTESDDLEIAARNAFHEAADEWSSAEYRMDVAATLARRCKERITSSK